MIEVDDFSRFFRNQRFRHNRVFFVFAPLPRVTAVNRVFLKDLHYIEDISISEMLVFTEIESSKVCDTFRVVTFRVLRL